MAVCSDRSLDDCAVCSLPEALGMHVLGMSKSNLDLKGAKGPKLELDYLRLVYAAKELQRLGEGSATYLCVMTSEIEQRISVWARKYDAQGVVTVVVPPSDAIDRNRLSEEKRNNIDGMIEGTMGASSGGKSDASYGRDAGEEYLRLTILSEHPGLVESQDKREFPFNVNWDFYGVYDT